MMRFQEWSEFFNAFVIEVTSGWWTLIGLSGFVFINGVFPPLPSDSLIITLGSVQDEPGTPWWLWVVLVAAGAALLGDFVAYNLGRVIGTDRWAWLRRPAMQRTLTWCRHELDKRGVLLIFVGRFIPGARVGINFVAGSTRYSMRRFLIIDAVASLMWAGWLIMLGAVGTELLGSQLLAMLVGIGVAVLLGLLCDRLFRLLAIWLDRKGVHIDPEGYQDTGVIDVERPIRLRRHHREGEGGGPSSA